MQYKTQLNTDKIIDLLKISIESWTKLIQSFCFERIRKIRTIDIFEFVLQLAKNDSEGGQAILSTMYLRKNVKEEDICTQSSMSEARDKVIINIWKCILNDISCELRKQIKTRRYFAIDGSVLVLPNKDFGGNFKKSNGSYVPHAYASMLYDIDYGFPVDVVLSDKLNERSAAIKHMDYLQEGDVVVMDRGYYSKDLFKTFTEKGIHVVFRMKSNTSKSEWNSNLDDILSKKDGIDCRFVKYTTGSNNYMILTSLKDKNIDSHEFIKTLYFKRWSIETAYGYVKENCSLSSFHAQTIRHLEEEFYANFLLFSISRLLEYHSINYSSYEVVGGPFNRNVLVNNYVRGKHNLKVNFKQCISLVNHYLDSILSQNIHNTFNKLKSPIMKKLSPIRENRHFKRVNISPREKWKHKRNLKNKQTPVIAENIM